MANNNQKMAQLIVNMFHSRTNAHIHHLRTKSYAKHMALGAYYDGIVDLVDAVAENYQGLYGIIASYPSAYTPPSDPIEDISATQAWIAANRREISDDTSIQNQIDSIADLINTTLYKLRNLS